VTIIARAEAIARSAHTGQVDKAGADYIKHVERVVGRVASEDAKAVAWLHDVIEDTSMTADDLRAAGIPEPVLEAVELLTRPKADPEYSYAEYIDALWESGNLLALEVKVADLEDHLTELNQDVAASLPPKLRPRYEKALAKLSPALVFRT
jgi:(p)ppGpp synthase/HD superfamily hydrolase